MNLHRLLPGPLQVGAVVLVLSVVVGGCVVEPEEHVPLYAGLALTAEPAVADRPLDIALQSADGTFAQTETFEPGVTVRTSFAVSAGPYRLVGRGGSCALDVVLEPELHTDFVFRIDSDGACEFELIRVHGPEFTHEATGTVVARVTAEAGGQLLVETRSLDDPANPVPDTIPPDEGNLAIIEPLWPGRYELRLVRDGTVIESMEVTIARKPPAGDLVELVLDGQPG